MSFPTLGQFAQDIEIEVVCEPEDIPVRGNAIASGDDALDKEVEDNILADLETNPWAWCFITVRGQFNGLEADESLGCCSYKSRQDFVEDSIYYDDMKKSVIQQLYDQAKAIYERSEALANTSVG